jgi:PTS system mannose-specific IIB component/fructoselysine and glucoselysine-specific PTS system IIB component
LAVELYRIDDRLIHGQVVVGWGQPLHLGFIVLVDDEVGASEWEQELYRMGVPPGVDVYFDTVDEAAVRHARYAADPRPGVLLTGSIETMVRLAERVPAIRRVNVGGVHHKAGRAQHLRYVFLTAAERDALRALAARGIEVSAQDVPSARPVPLSDLLAPGGSP